MNRRMNGLSLGDISRDHFNTHVPVYHSLNRMSKTVLKTISLKWAFKHNKAINGLIKIYNNVHLLAEKGSHNIVYCQFCLS